MKKLSTLILVFLMGLVVLFTGCATVDPVENNDDELIYNGNSVVNVGGYLYYANSFKSYKDLTGDEDYVSAAATSYLARLNANADLAATSKDYSPKNVENVSNEFVGQENSFMFTLGEYIYYTTPNRKEGKDEDGVVNNFYNYSAFYRSKLNGDDKNLFYTADAEISQVEVLKANGQYYIVMLMGSRLVKIQIGKDIGNPVTLAENVASVAMPKTYEKDNITTSLNWNGYIFYTVTNTTYDYSEVYRVSLADGTSKRLFSQESLTFIDRHKDILFFTETGTTTSVYYANVGDGNNSYAIKNEKRNFVSFSSISDINLISVKKNTNGGVEISDLGFTFIYNNSLYACKFAEYPVATKLTLNNNEGSPITSFHIAQVADGVVYLSTETGLYSVDLNGFYSGVNTAKTLEAKTLASMTKIYVETNLTSYDGKYIYYFATLEGLEGDDGEIQEVGDQTYYLYRVNISGAEDYQLLSLTSGTDRHS